MQPPEVHMAARNETGHREGFSVLASIWAQGIRGCAAVVQTFPGPFVVWFPEHTLSITHSCLYIIRPSTSQTVSAHQCGVDLGTTEQERKSQSLHSVTVTAIYGVSVPDTSTQNTRLETLGAENGIRTQTQIPPKPNQGVVKTNPFSPFPFIGGQGFLHLETGHQKPWPGPALVAAPHSGPHALPLNSGRAQI